MLIKCIECGYDVSNKANICPNCGCPVKEILQNYPATDDVMKCCPKCGKIEYMHFYPNGKKTLSPSLCPYCQSKYVITDVDETYYNLIVKKSFEESDDSARYKEELNKIENDIINRYAKSSSFFNEDDYNKRLNRFKNVNQIAVSDVKVTPLFQSNKPKCPTCGSTNLSKITLAHKAGKIALFGVFGMGDNGKTWKCNNCGSKW